MKIIFSMCASMLVTFASTMSFALNLEKHCYAEAQDAVLTTLSKHEILGKNLNSVTVTKLQLESNEGTERFGVIAYSSSALNDGTEGVKNTTSRWSVYSVPKNCDITAAVLVSSEDEISRP